MKTLKLNGRRSKSFLRCLIETSAPLTLGCTLDLSDTHFITPVSAVLASIFQICGGEVRLPSSEDARQYLYWMTSKNASWGDTRYLPITRLQQSGSEQVAATRLADILKGWINDNAYHFLDYALAETMENVFCHAQTDRGLWIHVQKYKTLGTVEICLADLGRGIPVSLADNTEYSNLPEYLRFVKALEVKVTRDPSRHGGEGLSSAREWIRLNPMAEGLILSLNYGWAKIDGRTCLFKKPQIAWPGTLIWMKIPKAPQTRIEDAWEALHLDPEE